jgi:pilus assembly protein CpaF
MSDTLFHSTGEPLLLTGDKGLGHPQRGDISPRESLILTTQLRIADALRRAMAPDIPLDLPIPRTSQAEARARKGVAQNLAKMLPEGMDAAIFTERVLNEVFGYGPLEALLAHTGVNEIMVNSPWVVFVEAGSDMSESGHKFLDDNHLERIINRIVKPLGRPADPTTPLVDARLPDGSRVNAVVRPCGVHGPSLTIRRFMGDMMTMQQLVNNGSLNKTMAEFLKEVVHCRFNVLVSGGTGSGKTTLVNALCGYIPEGDRIVTVEDAAELRLPQRNVVQLESKVPTIKHPTRVDIRDGVVNALRMRPDRIIVGEVRAGEALDMLQAMNTGHDGSMTTVHSNSPRDSISRLETCVLMSGIELPVKAIRQQIASAIGYVVHTTRTAEGDRKVQFISEVCRVEGDIVILNDIFVLDPRTKRHRPSGNRPSKTVRFDSHGVTFPPRFFLG